MAALSLADIHHLEAAVSWFERGQRANCFDELERIDHNNRGDERELALRRKLSDQWKQYVAAANLAPRQPGALPDAAAGYRDLNLMEQYPSEH